MSSFPIMLSFGYLRPVGPATILFLHSPQTSSQPPTAKTSQLAAQDGQKKNSIYFQRYATQAAPSLKVGPMS